MAADLVERGHQCPGARLIALGNEADHADTRPDDSLEGEDHLEAGSPCARDGVRPVAS